MNWEPWSGCTPYSEGCKYCYYYGPYAKRFGQNEVVKTDNFDWPIKKNAKGEPYMKAARPLQPVLLPIFFCRRQMSGEKKPGQ